MLFFLSNMHLDVGVIKLMSIEDAIAGNLNVAFLGLPSMLEGIEKMVMFASQIWFNLGLRLRHSYASSLSFVPSSHSLLADKRN